MKIPKALKRIGIFAAVILAVNLIWELFSVIMSVYNYNNTAVPDDLTAEQTLEKYFEYWDNGNLYGEAVLWEGVLELPDKYNSFGSGDFIDSIKLREYEYIGVSTSIKERRGYYDVKVFRAEYSKTFDDGWQGLSAGINIMEYVLYQKDENSPWRLCAVGCQYVD